MLADLVSSCGYRMITLHQSHLPVPYDIWKLKTIPATVPIAAGKYFIRSVALEDIRTITWELEGLCRPRGLNCYMVWKSVAAAAADKVAKSTTAAYEFFSTPSFITSSMCLVNFIVQNILNSRTGYLFYSQSPVIHQRVVNTINVSICAGSCRMSRT